MTLMRRVNLGEGRKGEGDGGRHHTCIRFIETPPSFKNIILLGTNIVITTLADINIPMTVKTFSEVKVFQ
jgi:hypothetical protein